MTAGCRFHDRRARQGAGGAIRRGQQVAAIIYRVRQGWVAINS